MSGQTRPDSTLIRAAIRVRCSSKSDQPKRYGFLYGARRPWNEATNCTIYAGLRDQKGELRESRIAVLAPDAAVLTAGGAYSMTDTTGSTSAGRFAWTIVWPGATASGRYYTRTRPNARRISEMRNFESHYSRSPRRLMHGQRSGARRTGVVLREPPIRAILTLKEIMHSFAKHEQFIGSTKQCRY